MGCCVIRARGRPRLQLTSLCLRAGEDLLPQGRVCLLGEARPCPGPHSPPLAILNAPSLVPLAASGDMSSMAVLGGGLGSFEEGVLRSSLGSVLRWRSRTSDETAACSHRPTLTTVRASVLWARPGVHQALLHPSRIPASPWPPEPRAQLVSWPEWLCDLLKVMWPQSSSTLTRIISSPTLNATLIWLKIFSVFNTFL